MFQGLYYFGNKLIFPLQHSAVPNPRKIVSCYIMPADKCYWIYYHVIIYAGQITEYGDNTLRIVE